MIPVLTTDRLTRAQAWREFATAAGAWMQRGYGAWSIEARTSSGYLGEAGIFHPDHYPEPEIGWTVMAGAEGKGIAHEAARAVRDFAYGRLGWATLVSDIDAGNARSIRLAMRLGARLDPPAARPEDDPCLVYRHPGPGGAA